uniref:Uncharacterized protein n=1 Tax=Romanomermis culicivorax TaxID=13658 RepID=A0A915IR70_ROMCU
MSCNFPSFSRTDSSIFFTNATSPLSAMRLVKDEISECLVVARPKRPALCKYSANVRGKL